jgi:hypothetical protein
MLSGVLPPLPSVPYPKGAATADFRSKSTIQLVENKQLSAAQCMDGAIFQASVGPRRTTRLSGIDADHT